MGGQGGQYGGRRGGGYIASSGKGHNYPVNRVRRMLVVGGYIRGGGGCIC